MKIVKAYFFATPFNFFYSIQFHMYYPLIFSPGKPALRTQDVSQNHFQPTVTSHQTVENSLREWGAESPSSQPWRTGFSELRNVLYTGGTCSIVLAPYATVQSYAAPIRE